MYPFIETLQIKDGVIQNIAYHNERLNRTRKNFWPNCSVIDLADYIYQEQQVPGILKCRILYDEKINEVTFTPYVIRPVHCIRLVYSDCISYTYKSSDREALNQLYSQRGDADDILIVKKGLLTDTSIANIALYNGTEWYTPVSPLLKGTKRAFLIDQGIIREQNILIGNLDTYSKITLFNALIDFRTIELSVDQLHMR